MTDSGNNDWRQEYMDILETKLVQRDQKIEKLRAENRTLRSGLLRLASRCDFKDCNYTREKMSRIAREVLEEADKNR